MNTWDILGVISALFVIVFFGKPNAVWGFFILGIFPSLLLSLIYLFLGFGFYWQIGKKVLIVFTLVGAVLELLGIIFRHKK